MAEQDVSPDDAVGLILPRSGGVAPPDAVARAAGIEPIVSIPRDPQAIADVLAALIRADIRRGARVSLTGLRYVQRREVPDRFDAPEVVRARGGDDCDGLVRAAGAHRGEFVGCVRSPSGGFHVFLLDAAGNVDDPCVAAGMPAPAPHLYQGAARARIRAAAPAQPTVSDAAGSPAARAAVDAVIRVAKVIVGRADAEQLHPIDAAAAVASEVQGEDQAAAIILGLVFEAQQSPALLKQIQAALASPKLTDVDKARLGAAIAVQEQAYANTAAALAPPVAVVAGLVEDEIAPEVVDHLRRFAASVDCPGTCGTR